MEEVLFLFPAAAVVLSVEEVLFLFPAAAVVEELPPFVVVVETVFLFFGGEDAANSPPSTGFLFIFSDMSSNTSK